MASPPKSILGKRLLLTDAGLVADGRLVGAQPLPFGNGNIFYVSSVIAGSDGFSPATALSTLAAAVAKCTANQGDVIVVLPGHVETISSSTALTMSIAGVRVVGLGYGNDRPTITLDTANTATINVTAASVSFENMIFVANFLSIAACFTLTTAKAFSARNCIFKETSSVLDFLNIVKSTGAANTIDFIKLVGNNWTGLGTTSVNAFLLSANDIEGAVIRENVVKLNRTADAAMVVITAGVLTNLDCGDNLYYSAQTATSAGSLINVGGTTSTGFVYRNYAQTLTTTADKLFTTTVGLAAFENRVSGAVGATGFVIPAADS